MIRYIVLGAMLLAACGGEAGSVGTLPPGVSNPASGGGIPIADLLASTERVKVVVKTSRVVYTPVSIVDEGGGSSYVPCQADAACSAYVGASCKQNFCATPSNVYGIFYVTDFQKDAQTDVKLPCDGKAYTVELYGAKGNGKTYDIQESWELATITTPLSSTACTMPKPSWNNFSSPSFTFPTIYAGIPAPNDKYSVGFENLQYPWMSTNWSATCNGLKPITADARSATFTSPAASVLDPINCIGLFYLDHSLLLSGGASWTLTVVAPAQIPVPSGGAIFPP